MNTEERTFIVSYVCVSYTVNLKQNKSNLVCLTQRDNNHVRFLVMLIYFTSDIPRLQN